MELFPAIDLRGGKAVRLVQGDYNQMTVFSDRPEEVALGFKAQGAKNLHVVDLDGAKDAALANFDTIEKLIKTTGLFVEVGGGLRNEASIDKYLSLGAGRVILGTVAVTNYPFVEEMVRKYGDKIAVGVDAKDGFVATHGWLETSEVRGVDFCRRLRDTGVIFPAMGRCRERTWSFIKNYRRLKGWISWRPVESAASRRLIF